MAAATNKKRDWFDYVGPVISSVAAALVLLTVTRSCSTSESTHNSVTTLTEHDFPLLQRDVSQTTKDVNNLQTTVAGVQKDVSDVKGSSVSKSDLESKNQGLQNQIRTLYENQQAFKDKFNEFQLQQARQQPQK